MKRDCRCQRVKHEHGTRRGYEADRCRCLLCRAAHANATRAYRSGGTWVEAYIDATETKNRLRALAAAGVTTRRVAAHSGLTMDMVTYLRGRQATQVTPRLAAIIEATHAALWHKGRSDADSRRCMTQVRALGYEPFLDELDKKDDHIDYKYINPAGADSLDEIAISEAMRGRRVHLTKAESREVVARLTHAGFSAAEIADRVGQTARTVQRKRAA